MTNWYESRAGTMSFDEAKDYFTEDNYPKPDPGETQATAIYNAYLRDVKECEQIIPTLTPKAMRQALTSIIEGEDPPAAIFKAAHDQAWP